MRWTAAALALLALGCLEAPPGASDPPVDAAGSALDAASPPMLFAAYRFEEPDPLADSSGNGRDALCEGIDCPEWVADRNDAGQAASFDGFIDLVTIDPLVEPAPFTVMAWLRMDSDEGGALVCPINRPFGEAGFNTFQICMKVLSPGEARLIFYTSVEPRALAINVAMDIATWNHVAIRWDGAQKTISWGGSDVAAAAGKTEFDQSDIRLGSDIDGDEEIAFFEGALDDLEIWDGALPEAAIREAAGR